MKQLRILSVLPVLGFSLSLLPGLPTQVTEQKHFDVSPGDSLVVTNDFGRVRIVGTEQPSMTVDIRKIASDSAHLENVTVVAVKSSDKVFVQSYFHEYAAESVYLEIRCPRKINVYVWGANPAVELLGLTGVTRVHTLTGLITAEDLIADASLESESGTIVLRSNLQPEGDIRLETIKGNLHCLFRATLDFRGWVRAGGKLNWNDEVELGSGYLEKQVGTGGPLVYAKSALGDVEFRLKDEVSPRLRAESFAGSELQQVAAPRIESPEADVAGLEETAAAAPTLNSNGGPVVRGDTDGSSPSTTSTAGGGYRLKVNVDWVYINASVRDRYSNRAIADLSQDDFDVFEDGSLQSIGRFDSTEAPFSLLLLLDVSGSTKSYMQMIKEASVEFVRLLKQEDRLALATFNSDVRFRQEFTNDRPKLEDSIRRVRSGGGTAFYDALHRSVTEFMSGAEGRKAIVVFTDGVDNQLTGDYGSGSQRTFRELFREVQEADSLIYTIFLDTEDQFGQSRNRTSGGVGGLLADIIFGGKLPPVGGPGTNPPVPLPGDSVYAEARRELEMIADQTGGRMYTPRRIVDLSPIYREIADDLRIQYTLGYASTNPSRDGRWRTVDVQVRGVPNAAVRARKGYYAPKG